jgi:hypothetical protein
VRQFVGRAVLASLLALSAGLGACRSAKPSAAPGGPQLPGASTPSAAVSLFMSAVKAGDLQALTTVWGTSDGPIRDNPKMNREQLDQRSIIIQRCYQHDSFRVLEESEGAGNSRMIEVEVARGRLRGKPNFKTVRGPGARWFVEDADIVKMQQFCVESSK